MRRSIWIGVIGALILLRLTSLIWVWPNNGPDEIGHLIITAGLSHGKVMTLAETQPYTAVYPYALYCPAPYVPGAVAMFIGSLFDSRLNELKPLMRYFTFKATRIARIGQLTWFFVFLFFLVQLTNRLEFRDRIVALLILGTLPQLTFVQSYVNLDSMGVAVFAYLVWALSRRRLGHVAFAVLLTLWSKLNYFCLLPLPVLVIAGWHWGKPKEIFQKWATCIGLPILLASSWFIYNYFTNTRQYGSLLGFSALAKMYPQDIGGMKVFTWGFLGTSLESVFGYFGWMNERMPEKYYIIGFILLFCPGIFVLLRSALRAKRRETEAAWHLGFLMVVLLNFFLHYFASYSNSYQPQGRYLFPAALIFLGYLCYGLYLIAQRSRALSDALAILMILFMAYSAVQSLQISGRVPARNGFPVGMEENG